MKKTVFTVVASVVCLACSVVIAATESVKPESLPPITEFCTITESPTYEPLKISEQFFPESVTGKREDAWQGPWFLYLGEEQDPPDLENIIMIARDMGLFPRVFRFSNGSPDEMKRHLLNACQEEGVDFEYMIPHADFVAASIPVALYHIEEDDLDTFLTYYSRREFYSNPGEWLDTDGDGFYDQRPGIGSHYSIAVGTYHAGKMQGRGSPQEVVNRYFQRVVDYYRNPQPDLPAALVYDRTWSSWAFSDKVSLGKIYAEVLDTWVDYDTDDNATIQRYKEEVLSHPFGFISLVSHGNWTGHSLYFGDGSDWDTIMSSDYHSIQPKALFYNLHTCRAGEPMDDFLAGAVDGLATIASARVGNMAADDLFYRWLNTDSFGKALVKWREYTVSSCTTYECLCTVDSGFGGMGLEGLSIMTAHPVMPKPETVEVRLYDESGNPLSAGGKGILTVGDRDYPVAVVQGMGRRRDDFTNASDQISFSPPVIEDFNSRPQVVYVSGETISDQGSCLIEVFYSISPILETVIVKIIDQYGNPMPYNGNLEISTCDAGIITILTEQGEGVVYQELTAGDSCYVRVDPPPVSGYKPDTEVGLCILGNEGICEIILPYSDTRPKAELGVKEGWLQAMDSLDRNKTNRLILPVMNSGDSPVKQVDVMIRTQWLTKKGKLKEKKKIAKIKKISAQGISDLRVTLPKGIVQLEIVLDPKDLLSEKNESDNSISYEWF